MAAPVAWFYTQAEMLEFGRRTGWKGRYFGDWDHPRDQVMVEYRPRRSLVTKLARRRRG